MKARIVGVRKREGEFLSKENKNIHFVSYDVYYQDLEPKDSVGMVVEKLTFQEKAFLNMLENKKISSLDQLIKFEFSDIFYNAQKKPVQLV